ncbi:transposase [Candidatus Paracaedibacter symbiosus]|uniref:transposase n=1 Tax=Candidatus Paracaedibacter symbiosus TaxID=244582 RepID=UPI000509A321|nr:transposase [Candidatus Paracaedibacter symbiosus]
MNQDQDYSSDLTASQWALIKDQLEQKVGKGRPRSVETRAVMNGILGSVKLTIEDAKDILKWTH